MGPGARSVISVWARAAYALPSKSTTTSTNESRYFTFPPPVAGTREFSAPPLYTKGARRPTTRALRRHGWRPKRTAKGAMREEFFRIIAGAGPGCVAPSPCARSDTARGRAEPSRWLAGPADHPADLPRTRREGQIRT